MTLKNTRLPDALHRQQPDTTPIWIMRQAGRYLPEYRKVRSSVKDFLTLCKTPELACEVTLQPLMRFDLDAAIVFSDILTIPDAMGLGLHFVENEGPQFTQRLDSRATIEALRIPNPEEDLAYVMQAITLIQAELAGRVPLIGFAGSPWTLACYMLQGGAHKSFDRIKSLLYTDPSTVQLLLDKLTQATVAYLQAQILAGVDVVMLFDTWGGLLSPHHYESYSLQYMRQIIAQLNKPVIVFTKHGGQWLNTIAQSGCHGVGIDWTKSIKDAALELQGRVAIQGNLDPHTLLAPPQVIEAEVKKIMDTMQDYPGFIFNLGHGILPSVPPEHVKHLVEVVHAYGASRTI